MLKRKTIPYGVLCLLLMLAMFVGMSGCTAGEVDQLGEVVTDLGIRVVELEQQPEAVADLARRVTELEMAPLTFEAAGDSNFTNVVASGEM